MRAAILAIPLAGCGGSIALFGDAGPDGAADAGVLVDTGLQDGSASAPSDAPAPLSDDAFGPAPDTEGGAEQQDATDEIGCGGDAGACGTGSARIEVRSGGGTWMWCETQDGPAAGRNVLTMYSSSGEPLYLQPFALPPSELGIDCVSCDSRWPIGIGIACGTLADGGQGTASSLDLVWDGTYFAQRTCGAGSTACLTKGCAAPGSYVANVCACPPSQWDSGTCASFTCIDVPFEFPSCAAIEVVLPGP
jgi:hypothetical protein